MEKKHTLFTLHPSLRDQGLYYVQGSKGIVIARKLSKENAELIVTAVNLHDELVEALKTARSYFEKYNCGGHTKDHDGKIYMDQGSAYLKTWLALSKLPTQ